PRGSGARAHRREAVGGRGRRRGVRDGEVTDVAGTLSTLDVRADFPMLSRQIDGRPIVYLDSAATSQKPSAVLDAMDDLYRSHNASIHRGVYTLGREATDAFEGARARIAAFAGWDTATTLFTANATAAINLVAYSWA